MGFDIYGMNPKENVKANDHEQLPLYSIVQCLQWEDQHDMIDQFNEKDTEQYWKEYNDYENSNPGIYFRNNVWWWRPLWQFVCEECKDILNDNDITRGNYNDNHKYSKTKAKKMAKILQQSVDNGKAKKTEKEWTKNAEEMKKSEDKDVQFFASYPFSEENVKRFIVFLNECGGFRIC